MLLAIIIGACIVLCILYVVIMEASVGCSFNAMVDTDVDVYERVEARIAWKECQDLIAAGMDAESARAYVLKKHPDVPSPELY